jgi:CO/xanthine dehydrogenase Mo-binding subunit
MTSMHATGRSAPRVDGPDKVTGSATYAADVGLPDTLWGRLLRSPHPHARIVAVDVSKARALPGVRAVITGDDVAGAMSGRRIFDIPLLAHEVVRFVGDPVAAVAAVDVETAERALALIDVRYEDLPAVFEPETALAPGAPLLHPRFNEYAGAKPLAEPSNLFVTSSWGTGDVEAGFAIADRIVEGIYTTATMHQSYMESHTCVVRVDDDGKIDVWASNKAPHYIKAQVAQTTGVDAARIHIHHVAIGGDFGGKGSQMNIPICLLLSRAAGQPVRMVMDYAEELSASNPRHPATVSVKTGVMNDGAIVACEIVAYYNTGAYAGFVPLGFLPGPRHAVGPYRIPHGRVTAHHVYTNRVPAGHMRGPGEPQTIFAMESHVDVIARTLGLDPAHVRLRNVIRNGDTNGLGEAYEGLHGAEAIEAALDASGYLTPKPTTDWRLRYGRGMGIGERAAGGGETHVGVTFQPDGSVVVNTSIFEQGSGTYTILRQMVADVLDIPEHRITVDVWDTDSTGFDSGAGASRNTRMASQAAFTAANNARTALFRFAVEMLGWSESAMTLYGNIIQETDSGDTIALSDLLGRASTPISGVCDHNDAAHADVTAFTVQIAEVTVDVETGHVELTRLTSVHDAGRVLNPQGHDGQIRGGAMQGVGYGLMEEMIVSAGVVTNPSFADYKIPTMADIPDMQVLSLESEDGVGPFNIKGIGENPFSPVAPAIANAIADAVGVRVTALPLSAERVRRALEA